MKPGTPDRWLSRVVQTFSNSPSEPSVTRKRFMAMNIGHLLGSITADGVDGEGSVAANCGGKQSSTWETSGAAHRDRSHPSARYRTPDPECTDGGCGGRASCRRHQSRGR